MSRSVLHNADPSPQDPGAPVPSCCFCAVAVLTRRAPPLTRSAPDSSRALGSGVCAGFNQARSTGALCGRADVTTGFRNLALPPKSPEDEPAKYLPGMRCKTRGPELVLSSNDGPRPGESNSYGLSRTTEGRGRSRAGTQLKNLHACASTREPAHCKSAFDGVLAMVVEDAKGALASVSLS